MKRLIVLRHAKSSWHNPGMDDFDRPLNARGLRDAPLMAERMLELMSRHALHPASILCSTAQRARETAACFCTALGMDAAALSHHDALYLASAPALVSALKAQAGAADCVLLVAHNPGMTDMLNALGDQRLDNLPTCGMACMEFSVDDWAALADGSPSNRLGKAAGHTVFIDYPKKQR
jgi:phosphohistidine phosphatase